MYLIRDEADNSFLVPDLLPKDGPKLDFNGIPAFEYAIRDGREVARSVPFGLCCRPCWPALCSPVIGRLRESCEWSFCFLF